MIKNDMSGLNVFRNSTWKFEDMVIPILVHIKNINDTIEANGIVYTDNEYDYIYNIRAIENDNLLFFSFVDFDILNSDHFEIEISSDEWKETLEDGVDYIENEKELKFLTPKSIFRYLDYEGFVNDYDELNKFKKHIQTLIEEVLNEFICNLKNGVGLGVKNLNQVFPIFHRFQTCYGNNNTRVYFSENENVGCFEKYSLREILSQEFYTARVNERKNIQYEEVIKKTKSNRKG